MRLRLRHVAGLAALAVGLAACTGSSGSSGSSSASGSGSSGGTFTAINEFGTIHPGAPKNPFNSSGNYYPSYDEMQLCWLAYSASNPNACFPGLAKSWTSSDGGRVLTVHLQPGAKWSDGAPVTANDVKVSLAIAFTQGTAQPANLGSVKVVNSSTVQLIQSPGANDNTFASDVLQLPVVPAKVYGHLLPADIWSLIATSQYGGSSKAKTAAAKKASGTLVALGKKIAAYAPSQDLSAGPYVLSSLNPGEAVLTKNKYFYAASRVHPSQVVLRAYSGNSQIWNYLISGQLDAAPYTAMPTNILHKVLSVKGNKELVSRTFVAASLGFNEHDYPYNLRSVRQALAYLINRQAVQKVAEPVSGSPSKYTTGMIDSVVHDYLSSGQMSKLNTYSYSPSKATHLLEGAGFKKVNGQWMLPNGKPWTITVQTVNGFSDWIEASKVISSELTTFGIPTTAKISPDYASYLTELANGKYAVGFWLDALGPNLYTTYQRLYGTNDGYVVQGGKLTHQGPNAPAAAEQGNWEDTPTTYQVPGVGAVNPGELTFKLSQVPVAQQRAIVAKLAQATDYELPVIQLWNYLNVQFVNTSRWTDFPSGNEGLLNNQPGLWISMGYVHKR